jgi:hypothetical protein
LVRLECLFFRDFLLRPPACISSIDTLVILFGSTSKLTPSGFIGITVYLSPLNSLIIASFPLFSGVCLSPLNLTMHDDDDSGDTGDNGRGEGCNSDNGDGDCLALSTIDEMNGEFSTSAAAGATAKPESVFFRRSSIAENILYNNVIKNNYCKLINKK